MASTAETVRIPGPRCADRRHHFKQRFSAEIHLLPILRSAHDQENDSGRGGYAGRVSLSIPASLPKIFSTERATARQFFSGAAIRSPCPSANKCDPRIVTVPPVQ